AAVHDAASAARTDPAVREEDADDVHAVLVAVESAAAAHHQAVGGVWEPWPGAGPQATAYPSDGTPAPPPPTPAGAAEVLDLLEEGAAQARAAALADTGSLGQVLASVAI